MLMQLNYSLHGYFEENVFGVIVQHHISPLDLVVGLPVHQSSMRFAAPLRCQALGCDPMY